jgi:putative YjhG/YagF family dehydratase
LKIKTTTFIIDYLNPEDSNVFKVKTHADGPQGKLPISGEYLAKTPSGDIFGLTQNIGMGLDPSEIGKKQFLLLSTQGGIRDSDGSPIALGYHTGHWEIGILMQAAAEEIRSRNAIPFAGYCSDPCDGRTQGTEGMMDSLAYRNDAATIFRRLIRSLPTRDGVLGIATCDKGLPAMMMALVSMQELPCVLVPGGVTLPPTKGEDAGEVQSIGARYAQREITLEYAQEAGCRACASPGGGCQFLGTAATSQVIGEALGISIVHSALAPSGQFIWLNMAQTSAQALLQLEKKGNKIKDIITDASVRNAMVVHAAFGGSTNLLLHLPAIAHAAGLRRPTVEDWIKVNRQVPRLVDVLPNGPIGHPTVRVYLAGGVPEVMLKLRDLDLLDLNVNTVSGCTLEEVLKNWEQCSRRSALKKILEDSDGVRPDDVIMDFDKAQKKGLTCTLTFPQGNLAPEGSVIKSTAIDPSLVNAEGIYQKKGPAKVFTREKDAISAIKSGYIQPGDIIVLICAGPMGSGMEETYQVTSALKYLSWGKHVAVVTDARFSGISTGACIGHVGPEALAGGPIGKVLEGDIIEIIIDRKKIFRSLNLIGAANDSVEICSIDHGNQLLRQREPRSDLSARTDLPADTQLWAALQAISGGTWGGCVYDVKEILKQLNKY